MYTQVCDRCGAVSGKGCWKMVRFARFDISPINNEPKDLKPNIQIDLCPSCFDSFVDFVKTEPKAEAGQ